MTDLAFHFNVPEPLPYACALLRENLLALTHTAVTGSAQTLQELDAALWRFSSTDFLAHCSSDAPPSMLTWSPIVLLAAGARLPPRCKVLVNLGGAVLENLQASRSDRPLDALAQIIEIVGLDEADRHTARQRWKHYSALGLRIERRDFQQSAGPLSR